MSNLRQSYRSITTPQSIGPISLTFSNSLLTAISFTLISEQHPNLKIAGQWQQWFDHYFSGKNPQVTPPYRLSGTNFQRQVWRAVAQIPYGETRSYSEIARLISRPTAVRAVATAIGKNPLPIVIPCHRVIPANGKIGNYSGGTSIKKALIALESKTKMGIYSNHEYTLTLPTR